MIHFALIRWQSPHTSQMRELKSHVEGMSIGITKNFKYSTTTSSPIRRSNGSLRVAVELHLLATYRIQLRSNVCRDADARRVSRLVRAGKLPVRRSKPDHMMRCKL